MKKRYLVLALIAMLWCMSIVSASENVSSSDDLIVEDNQHLPVGDDLPAADAVNGSSSEGNDLNTSGEAIDENNASVNESDVIQNSSNNNISQSNPSGKDSAQNTNNNPAEKQKPHSVVTKNVASYYGTVVKYNVKVLDKNKKAVKNQKVVVTIGKKSVTKYTSDSGVATFTLNCAAGSYVVKYAVGTIKGSNTYKVKNKVTMTILKWGLKGDVSKAKLIKNNMPNNQWVKKAVAATKKGLPLLKFVGGKGKVVFMTAGVHGNEISSQVAAMKMIKYLSDNPIKGTVYIIPFVNVKAISKKVRFTDKDFNRVAAKSGTISNKIVKLVVKYKCDAYGDFHTTKPGGAPGQNIVMGSKSPASKSAALTKYIAKNCKVNKRIYSYAGQQYPGALADNVNKKGIAAVICEVVLPHNTVTKKSVNISLNMMKSLLKYNSVI